MTCPRCNAPAEDQTLREFGGVCPKCLLAFSEEQDAPAFPNLEILEMIGQGGMGVVYKARQKNLDRVVALKVLSPHLSDDPEFVERFTREAKALAQLSHPNIVGIHDSGIHDRVPYLVMEYVDGTPLRKMLGGKLTPDRALEVIPQICDALQYAHTHGVVHRDIKPENILIDRQGRVKIADFGLAKLSKVEETRITQSGYVMGTPRYMAPEQFEAAGRVDHRADIYSLGVVFYEMLTGEVPMGRFKPPSAKADVDHRLDPVVLKSLEREPDDRYQSAGEVKEEVAGLNRRRERPAPPPQQPRPNNLRKSSGIIAVLGVMALVISVMFGYFGWPIAKVFVLVGGALLLSSFVVLLFSLVFKPPGPPAPAPREGPQILGCIVIVALGVLGFIAVVLILTVPRSAESPRMPEPPSPVVAQPGVRSTFHESKQSFNIDDVFLTEEELPKGFTAIKLKDEDEVLEQAGLPLELRPDLLQILYWKFTNGAFLVGLQFRTDLARLRWEKEPSWKLAVQSWHYRLAGPGRGVILLRHDGTALGEAAKELLKERVMEKWATNVLQPRKK